MSIAVATYVCETPKSKNTLVTVSFRYCTGGYVLNQKQSLLKNKGLF